ncbi:hypothetical protein KCU71_g554, partial [Aureobasidium melanogenum]
MDGLGSSSATRSEAAAQENGQLRLAQSLKNYQTKSSEEIAAILQQWQEIKRQYMQTATEATRLIRECQHICESIFVHQALCAVRINRLPPTNDLGQVSAEQLQSLHRALEHDDMARETTWKVYEMHKRIHAACDAFEELVAFREEHFVLAQPEQQTLEVGKTSIATVRHFARVLGPKLLEAYQKIWDYEERDG